MGLQPELGGQSVYCDRCFQWPIVSFSSKRAQITVWLTQYHCFPRMKQLFFCFLSKMSFLNSRNKGQGAIVRKTSDSRLELFKKETYPHTLDNTGQVVQLGVNSWARGRIWAHTSLVQNGSNSHDSRRASCHLPRIGARWTWGSSWALGAERWCSEHGFFLEKRTWKAQTSVGFSRDEELKKFKK